MLHVMKRRECCMKWHKVSFKHSLYLGNLIGISYVISILRTKISFTDKDKNDHYL